jgi:energy-coupling factor transport system ATP-binding protein
MIQLKNFSFNYGKAETPNLNRVNITIEPGQFVLVCGGTGSGKSTLLKALVGLAPHFTGGKVSGQRLVNGLERTGSLPHETAELIGFVNQQPEGSFVAETVIEELAFTLEQLGVPVTQMHERIDAALKATELDWLRNRRVTELSGGQQQRVAIAAALSAGQKILILDEPTSALDPKTAHELLEFIHDLCRKENLTAIVAEHRIERLIDLVDSVIVVSRDGSIEQGAPDVLLERFEFVPPLIKLGQVNQWKPLPLSIDEARKKIKNPVQFKKLKNSVLPEVSFQLANLSVSYGTVNALDNVQFRANRGEVVAVMGENGSGKTSLLWKLSELLPESAMVPQQASDLLFLNSLSQEFADSDEVAGAAENSTAKLFEGFAGRIDASIHPRDLSSGQQLALVLALQLVKPAGVVLLDEPTRGLDYSAKQQVSKVIHRLAQSGKTVVFASHDVEFVALTANRVVQLSEGKVNSDLPVDQALAHTGLLATQVAQIFQTEGLITLEQVIVDA